MADLILAPAALRDIGSILAWTRERFGLTAQQRYHLLVDRAILDIAEDPVRIGSRAREDISPVARTYHLWHSRNRAGAASERVRQPRHFLLYRITDEGRVEVGRVLHESMDIATHLPESFEPS